MQIIGVRPPALPIGKIDTRPQYKKNTVFLNRGDGTYAEIGQLTGLEATEWSWAPIFLDVDLDGYEDVLVTTGYTRDSLNADPAFGVSVGDLDGDGNEDISLSQNFFAVDNETARYDAGRGLWLRGDGHGNVQPIPGQDSGVQVYGEPRGCVLGDYDGDGRVDLVVTQNGAETKLYHNESAKPGLRVRLLGTPENRTGVGASIRLLFGNRSCPVCEVHAGSGYWSQNSAVHVLGTPEPPSQIWVR